MSEKEIRIEQELMLLKQALTAAQEENEKLREKVKDAQIRIYTLNGDVVAARAKAVELNILLDTANRDIKKLKMQNELHQRAVSKLMGGIRRIIDVTENRDHPYEEIRKIRGLCRSLIEKEGE